jgi:hypothetical protein
MAGCARRVVLADAVSRDFDFTGFTRIVVGQTSEFLNWWNAGNSHFEIEVEQSTSYKVSVSANENIFDFIDISKSEDTLKIIIDKPRIATERAVMGAQITMPELRSIDLSGESIGVVQGFNSNQDFSAQVSGVSNLDLNIVAGNTTCEISSSSRATIRGIFSQLDARVSGASTLDSDIQADKAGYQISSSSQVTHRGSSRNSRIILSGASTLDIDAETGATFIELSSSSRLTGDMIADDIDMQLSGASRVQLKGSGGNAIIRGSSSSDANMPDFTLKDTEITLSGASQADISVNGRLDANLTNASSLEYGGNPSLGDINATGASNIVRN